MDPTDFITSLLEGMGGLSLLKADNAEFSFFKLSNSPMNFGCVTHQDYSVQIYVEAPKANPPELCVPKDLQANTPKGSGTPTAPRRLGRTFDMRHDPLFSVDSTFDFDTRPDALPRHTQLSGVPISVVKHQNSFSVTAKGLNLTIDLQLRGEKLEITNPTLQSESAPPNFRVLGASRRLNKALQGCRKCGFARGGRDWFGLFQSAPGRRLPMGSDTVRFSKAAYSHVFALCRLQPQQDGAFTLKSYQLIALQKDRN